MSLGHQSFFGSPTIVSVPTSCLWHSRDSGHILWWKENMISLIVPLKVDRQPSNETIFKGWWYQVAKKALGSVSIMSKSCFFLSTVTPRLRDMQFPETSGGKGRGWNMHRTEVPPLHPHLLSSNAIFVPFTMLVEKGWKWWREQRRPSDKPRQIVWSSSRFLRVLSPSAPSTENLASAVDSPLCYAGDNWGFYWGWQHDFLQKLSSS